jgi:Na+/glutamate symporter
MNAIQALTIFLVVFGIGELVAEKTKAVLSTTLVIAFVLLMGFWFKLPSGSFFLPHELFQISNVGPLAGVLIFVLITSLGTLMDLEELKRQWKTVLVALITLVIATSAIIFLNPFIYDRNLAYAGAPIFAGANGAVLILLDVFKNKVTDQVLFQQLNSFILLVLVFQNFVGIPISSALLRIEAKRFVKDPSNVALYLKDEGSASGKSAKRKLLQLPASFNRPVVTLAKLGIAASIAEYLASLTHGQIHPFVVCLLVGIFLTELGFLEKQALSKSGSATFILFATTMVIFANLTQTTPELLMSLIFPLLACLGTGAIATIVFGTIVGKMLGMSPFLAVPIGLTCTFGFPTTLFISQEVAAAIGGTPDEKKAIENYILPKMITGGFVTVTIASILIAGFVGNHFF